MNRKGHVLVHVLITSIIAVVIATGLAQMLLQRYTASARATSGATNRSGAQGALNQAVETWNSGASAASICSALPSPWSLSSGGAGSCGCIYTNSSVTPNLRIRAHLVGGNCQIDTCTAQDDGTFPSACQ